MLGMNKDVMQNMYSTSKLAANPLPKPIKRRSERSIIKSLHKTKPGIPTSLKPNLMRDRLRKQFESIDINRIFENAITTLKSQSAASGLHDKNNISSTKPKPIIRPKLYKPKKTNLGRVPRW